MDGGDTPEPPPHFDLGAAGGPGVGLGSAALTAGRAKAKPKTHQSDAQVGFVKNAMTLMSVLMWGGCDVLALGCGSFPSSDYTR